ncbi:hypothetical protein OPQ81_010358 [Rhizoctonia solani]|nr:hypothetical protein OPQ81_010358 [Rhizoctonia solani]
MAPATSDSLTQVLEAAVRNIPKLKELNYAQWKNLITHSIKNAELWGYIGSSIERPTQNPTELAKYFDEAGAVRNAILGSLEPAAQRYIEDALDPRDAWLALEEKYLTAENDRDLVAIERRLADMKLEEGEDIIEHVAEFCRLRCHLNGSRLALDEQASVNMLYRSLPASYRKSVLTPEGTDTKDLGTLCVRLRELSQMPEPQATVDDESGVPEDYTNWGVPEDIKVFGLTGDKNPLLEERAAVTCRDCLLKDHKAGTAECPQNEWRKELWGKEPDVVPGQTGISGCNPLAQRPMALNIKRLSYEFSEPVKVVLDFDELGLHKTLRENLRKSYSKPSAIQQCAILPIVNGRNVLVQAPPNNGKTTAIAISILQIIDTALPHVQALIITPTNESTTAFGKTIANLAQKSTVRCYSCNSSSPLARGLPSIAEMNKHQIFAGTPDYLLGFITRNIINMRRLRTVVLDDVDKLLEAGTEDHILEVYRHVPPLAQVVASCTLLSLAISNSVAKLLVDPLQILVSRNEGVSIGTHFYITIPEEQKPSALKASFSALGANGAVVVHGDTTEASSSNYPCHLHSKVQIDTFKKWPWESEFGYYYLRETMDLDESSTVIQSFQYALHTIGLQKSKGYCSTPPDPVSMVALITTDTAFSTAGLPMLGVPLINYDIPSNVEDYAKRLDQWRMVDPGQSHLIVTFVTADTDEILAIQDLERYYGVHAVKLLWSEGCLH